MITKNDVDAVVHGLQASGLREGLGLVCVLVDPEDETVAVFAPDGVNKVVVLQMALDQLCTRTPDREFDTHPRGQG